MGNLEELKAGKIDPVSFLLREGKRRLYPDVDPLDAELEKAFKEELDLSSPPSPPPSGKISFKNPEVETEYEGVNPKLKKIYEGAPDPISFSSGKRPPEENARVGGLEDSKHLPGDAADRRLIGDQTRNNAYLKSMGVKVVPEKDHLHDELAGEPETYDDPELDDQLAKAFGLPQEPDSRVPVVEPPKPNFRKLIKRGFEQAAPRANKLLGLDVPQKNKTMEFLRNLNKGIVDTTIGFPSEVAAGALGLPEELSYAKEHPAEYGKEVVKETGKQLLTPFDPREYTLEKFYEDPAGRLMNLAMAFGLGKGTYSQAKSLKRPAAEPIAKPVEEAPLTPEEAFAERVQLRKEQESLGDLMAGRDPEAAIPLYPPAGRDVAGLLTEKAGPSMELLPTERLPAGARPPTENTPVTPVPKRILKATPEESELAGLRQALEEKLAAMESQKIIKALPEQRALNELEGIQKEFERANPPAVAPTQIGPPPKIIKATPNEKFSMEMRERLAPKKEGPTVKSFERPQEVVVPESVSTLELQMDALKNNRVKAVLATPGAKLPEIPKRMRTVETNVGTWVYDPLKIKASKIKEKVANGTHGEILGHVEPKGPATTNVVTAMKGGVEAKTSVVSPEKAPAQIKTLKRQFPGAKITAGGPELAAEVLSQRSSGGGTPPKSGLVVSAIGKDGKVYYGKPGDIHANLMERFPNQIGEAELNKAGFSGPDGRFLTRQEALKNLSPKVKPGEVLYSEDIPKYQKQARLKSVPQLLKEAIGGSEKGAIGWDVSRIKLPENVIEMNVRAKAAQNEIVRRVNQFAKEKGIAIDEALAKLKIDPVYFAKIQEGAQQSDTSTPAAPPNLKVISGRPPQQEPLIAGTGLKTDKVVEGRLAYNPEKINAPADVEALFKDVSKEGGEFKGQRLSKTDEAVRQLAEDVGVTVDQLVKARPGSIANAETIFRAREMVMNLAQDFRDSLKTVDTATATPEQLQVIKEKHLRLMGAMKAVAGFRTESSNIFRQFKQKIAPNEDVIIRDLVGDMKRLDLDVPDLAQFAKKARELTEPTKADKLWHLWYLSILSGPSTHLKNFLGNASQITMELGRVGATKQGELPSAIAGLYQGLLRGAAEGKKILKEGETSKFEERGLLPIRFEGKARILNAADYVGRALSSMDALFRGGAKGMEAGGLAREQAIAEGLKGAARKQRTSELFEEKFASPEAEAFGARSTYTQKPAGVMGALSEAVSGFTRRVGMGKFVAPFTRIVANVVNNSLDWTPVGIYRGLLPEGVSGRLAKGKSQYAPRPYDIKTGRQKHQQIGRGVLGTMAMGYFANQAAEGNLTGSGPSDWGKKQQLISAGWRPNSIKINGKYVPYSQWGPLALPMALVGNYFDAARYGDLKADDLFGKASGAVLGSVNTIMDMSFLSGVSDLMTAVHDWERKGTKFIKNFVAQQVSTVVPNMFKQVGRYFDPTVYDTQTIGEKIKSNLRISSGLKPALDVWGEPMKGEKLTQLQWSDETTDPVKKFLAENQVFISIPSRNTKIKKDGQEREMTRDEYYDYIKISGPRIKERIGRSLDRLKEKDKEKLEKIVSDIVHDERERAKKEIAKGS